MIRAAFRWPLTYVLAGIAGLVAAWAFAGNIGVQAMLLAYFGAGFSMLAMHLLLKLGGQAFRGENTGPVGSAFIILAFLVKLPVLVGCGILARRMGVAAMACFLVGVVGVYSLVVGWVQAQD